MATRKAAAPKGRAAKKGAGGERRFIREDTNKLIQIEMDKFAMENYKRYGLAVLENRAIPDFRDGLNPVNRRVLWSMNSLGFHNKAKLAKAARVVGDVIGRYHPHGDASAYDAMVGMTNLPKNINNIRVGLIEGGGNWGSLSGTSAAAQRYTEARLSAFSDEVLFNRFYTPVMDKVPNFDNTTEEPLVLPSLLPLIFLNGRFGIAPGATCRIPAFNGNTILDLLDKAYAGEEITPKLLGNTLRAVTTFGGMEKEDELKGAARKALFTDKRGKLNLRPTYVFDEKKRTLTFTKFAFANFEKTLGFVSAMDSVQSIEDLSTPADRIGKLVVTLKKLGENKQKTAIAAILKHMELSESYVLNFTRRAKDDIGQACAEMRAMTLPKAFTAWVKWRTKLEQRACTYWIKEDEKEIKRLLLLIQAVDYVDYIVKLLKDKSLKSKDDVYTAYAKKAKVSNIEAEYVLTRPIITLRNLSKGPLEKELAETRDNMKKLQKRHDNPLAFMRGQLKDFRKFFVHD